MGALVTDIHVGELGRFGSDDGLAPARHWYIIWTNVNLLPTPFGFRINIQNVSFEEMRLIMSSPKWRQFPSGLNALIFAIEPHRIFK